MPQRPAPFQTPSISPVIVVSENDKLILKKNIILMPNTIRTAVIINTTVVDLCLARPESIRFWFDSTLDQPMDCDIFGSVTATLSKASVVAAGLPIIAQQITTYGVLVQDWFPFMACVLSSGLAIPISGNITVEVYWQEEKK